MQARSNAPSKRFQCEFNRRTVKIMAWLVLAYGLLVLPGYFWPSYFALLVAWCIAGVTLAITNRRGRKDRRLG